MMIVMKETATEEEVEAVVDKIERAGARAHRSAGARVTVIGAIGDVEQDANVASLGLEGQPGVDRVVPILKPYKLASAQITHGERTVLDIDGRKVGGEHFALIAGPVHGRVARADARDGARRARRRRDAAARRRLQAAHLARTRSRASARRACGCSPRRRPRPGLPIVTELMDVGDLDAVLEVADVIQIGARNMQNYPLLAEVGRSGRPVLLKRGLSATLDELLMAAEYILKEGNPNVMLCERGIRTFETAYRFTLDLMAVPVLKELVAPAGDRRPEPRGRPARPGAAAVAGRGRRRRRRHHRRGAPEPGRGDLRRAAGAARGGLRRVRAAVERAAALAGKALAGREPALA